MPLIRDNGAYEEVLDPGWIAALINWILAGLCRDKRSLVYVRALASVANILPYSKVSRKSLMVTDTEIKRDNQHDDRIR